jgi:hypothetical protein
MNPTAAHRVGSIDSASRLAMSVQELEAAVSSLSPEDLARFTEWFEDYTSDEWDRQIKADARSGRLDAPGRQADADFEAGRVTEL